MEKSKSLVSIIMNCYNGQRFLKEAIDSVYQQTYHDWEIIFWDNASTDNSLKIAKSYDSRLLWFESDKTVLLGEARNKAINNSIMRVQKFFLSFFLCSSHPAPN